MPELIFCDFTFSHLSPYEGDLLQIAAVYRDRVFRVDLRPTKLVDTAATHLHGITAHFSYCGRLLLERHGQLLRTHTQRRGIELFMEFCQSVNLGSGVSLVAHTNMENGFRALVAGVLRRGFDPPPLEISFVDVMKLAKTHHPRLDNYGLQNLMLLFLNEDRAVYETAVVNALGVKRLIHRLADAAGMGLKDFAYSCGNRCYACLRNEVRGKVILDEEDVISQHSSPSDSEESDMDQEDGDGDGYYESEMDEESYYTGDSDRYEDEDNGYGGYGGYYGGNDSDETSSDDW